MHPRTLVLALCLAPGLAACGGHKTPAGPTPAAPQITCPADIAVHSVPTPTQAVTFDPPMVTGGATPVQTTCDPASGSTFPLGATKVNCTASDASSRTAMCSFNVTLSGFSIGATKYEAFGDSLTAGETGRANITPLAVDAANSYPTKLEQELQAAHPDQGIVVINRGVGGFNTDQTQDSIRRFVPADRPDVVLLLVGYNNLNDNGLCSTGKATTQPCINGINDTALGVRDCIRRVKEANAGVQFTFVSTLTPPGPSGSNRIDPNAINQANIQIRQMIAAEGATLVDSYNVFLGHEAEYVNTDGLHLTPAGYQALADTFFAAIQANVPLTPLSRRQ